MEQNDTLQTEEVSVPMMSTGITHGEDHPHLSPHIPAESLHEEDENMSQDLIGIEEVDDESAKAAGNMPIPLQLTETEIVTDDLSKNLEGGIITTELTSSGENVEICNKDAEILAMDVIAVDNTESGSEDVNVEAADVGASEATTNPSYYFWKYELSSEKSPRCLISTKDEEFYKPEKSKKCAKYMKGCKWAPDGSCLLSSSDDDILRIFNFPSCFSAIQDWKSEDCSLETEDWTSALQVKEGGLIYDYAWYPLMSSMDPVSACLLTSSSEAPIHLWDAFSGKLRASYQAFDNLEQLVSAQSLAFDPSGETIYSGFEKCIRLFNITRPGKEYVLRTLKQPEAELNQFGIVACICVNPALKSFYAVGSFDKTIGLYYEDGSVICLLQGHSGGITHMKFSSDGMKLFTGGRNDSRLMCWDMRNMGEAYKIFERVVSSHQRIYFDVTPDDRYLLSGGTDGIVKIWDVESEGIEPYCTFQSNSDCVNGISCNPYVPLLATSSGQRHFYEIADDSDDDDMFVKPESSRHRSCDIKLWKLT